jgi:hypothetical protein
MKTAEDLIAVSHQEPTVFQIKPVFPDVPNQSEVLLIIAVAPLFSGTEASTVVGEDTSLLVHLLVYVESDPDGVAEGMRRRIVPGAGMSCIRCSPTSGYPTDAPYSNRNVTVSKLPLFKV